MDKPLEILFAVPFNYRNKGDVAVLNSMISLLTKEFPGGSLVTFIQNPILSCDRNYPSNVRLLQYLSAHAHSNRDINFSVVFFKCLTWAVFYKIFKVRLTRLVKDKSEALEAYVNADVVVYPARDFISSSYGVAPLISAIFLSWFVTNILGKPQMLYASQIGPFTNDLKGKFCSFLTKLMMKRMSLITVRDQSSRERLWKMGVRNSAKLTADPAFLLTAISLEEAKSLLPKGLISCKKPLIGINCSALIYKFGFPNIPSVAEKRNEYIKLMARVVDGLIQKLDAAVLLVPHVFDLGNSDKVIAEEIWRETAHKERVHIVNGEKEPEELKGLIGLCDLFIAARHHPFIHSVTMSVPTIGIDYNFKIKGLARILQCEEWIIDIRPLNSEDLILKTEALWKARLRIRKHLVQKTNEIKERATLNVALLRELTLAKKRQLKS